MKKFVVPGMVLLLLFTVSACKGADEERLSDLEAEVRVLKQEATARDTAYQEELTQVRKNLEAIQSLLQIDQGATRLEQDKGVEVPSDESLDAKAKAFVNENLDRLLDVTKKLLDKMETELDDQLKKMKETPPVKGDEV